MFYDPDSSLLFAADTDETEKRLTPISDSERELNPEQTFGEAIETVGDELGWESLSEFARDHLEDDSE